MIKTNSIENLTGSAKVNLNQILVWDADTGNARLPDGSIISINGSGDSGGGGGPVSTGTAYTKTRLNVDDFVVSYSNDTQYSNYSLGNWYNQSVSFFEGDGSGTFPLNYTFNQEMTFKRLFIDTETGSYSPTRLKITIDNIVIVDEALDSNAVTAASAIDFTFPDNTKGTTIKIEATNNYYLKFTNIEMDLLVPDINNKIGSGGTSEVQDDQISIPGANIAAGGNQYRVTQDVGQPDWSKIQVKVIQLAYSNIAAGGTFPIKRIKIEATDSNYHPLKILMYDESGSQIDYRQNNPADLTDLNIKKQDGTNMIRPENITGIFSPSNSSYHISRTFDITHSPDLNGGWHSVVKVATTGPRQNAVTFVFDTPQDVAEIHLMRNYSVSTFGNNTGSTYVTLIDETGTEMEIEMPPPSDYTNLSDFTKSQPSSSSGETVNLDETFNVEFSTDDGISFIGFTELGKSSNTVGTMVTTTMTFDPYNLSVPASEIILKVQNDQVSKIDRLLVDAWYKE